MGNQIGLEAKYINPFVTSISNVFKTMVAMSPQMGKPFIKYNTEISEEVAISIIGIAGKVCGNISLILTKKMALKVASNFLSTQFDSLNDDVKDAIGELTNMIAGGAKKFFAEMDESFKIALPTVLVGTIQDIHSKDSVPSLFLPFATDEGTFYLKVCLVKEDPRQSA